MQNVKLKLRKYEIQFYELSEKTWKEECIYKTSFFSQTKNDADCMKDALFVARELAFSGMSFTSFSIWEIKTVDLEGEKDHEYYSEIAMVNLCSNQFTEL